MALRYDFDMVAVTPEGLPDQFGDLAVTGVATEKRAMFRDARVVAALEKADASVRTFFLESGFALQVYDSGAPPGRYPISDEAARVGVIEKLTANLGNHDLSGVNWGGFDFQSFLASLDAAKPLEDETLLAPTPRAAPATARPRPKNQTRRGIALLGLGVGLLLLLYVALEFVQ
ncbi:hypothetical protein SLH49_00495 [Cognatiyoonia sp. IB215446]|uniref:hypothetical protein n=1 Tax=Cognatiyoonia sp. IB215446 TaxID=3097355 RepID=UPI002A12D86A|nr:hypothetical protein [Cognatiyoonia sp. IB215446]MDX8346453.1 hypothetical protein [Cognatiyoonia sp. IB215446]